MDKQVFEQRIEEVWEKIKGTPLTNITINRMNTQIRLLELAHAHRSTANIEDERAAILEAVREVKAKSGRGPRQKKWANEICDEIISDIAQRTGTQLEVDDGQ